VTGGFAPQASAGALLVDVLVQPRASRRGLGPVVGDRLKVAVAAPPVDGAANAAVIEAFAAALRIPKSAVTIVRGEAARRKTVRLAGVSAEAFAAVLSGPRAPRDRG
jgi:uncharacterized protein (TIGR00251 family)